MVKTTKGTPAPIPTVNYHLWKHCNMSCHHCFAKFEDISGQLSGADSLELVGMLAEKFEKINFAGGEPMLCPHLDCLIFRAKEAGLTTSMVTNGSMLTDAWLEGMRGSLDILALSIDSAIPHTHEATGRSTKDGPISTERYLEICGLVKRHMRLKVNTVVTALNWKEDMSPFVARIGPERWKIMHALPIEGQNEQDYDLWKATAEQFDSFVSRNGRLKGVKIVPESNELMTDSYLMVSPDGRFYDNGSGTYRYSPPILDVGVKEALEHINVDPETFEARGGRY